MQKLEKYITRGLPFLFAIIQWSMTSFLKLDMFFFRFDYTSNVYFLVKTLYFIALIVLWSFIFNFLNHIRGGELKYKRGLKVFVIYFSIILLLEVLLWPGTWSWDDISVLNNASHLILDYWQHFLSSLWQMLMSEFGLGPGGIILVQNIIISMCVAFIITELDMPLGFIIVFLLPPVLFYQFSGYRMGIYVFFELMMLVMFVTMKKSDNRISLSMMGLLCFLCIIVSTWRSEAFLYVPFCIGLILMCSKKVIKLRYKTICIAAIIVGVLLINYVQNTGQGDSNYKIMSLLRPCAVLVRNSDLKDAADLISEIDKVVKVDIILEHPEMTGDALYWEYELTRTGYTEEEYEGFVKAIIKLGLRYPYILAKERFKCFIDGIGITMKGIWNVELAADLYDADNGNRMAEIMKESGWCGSIPVSVCARKKVIHILGCMNGSGYNRLFLKFIWNALIPLTGLFYGWIKTMLNKQWYYFALFSAVLIRLSIVILTQPSSWFMYILSFYFLGYVYIFYEFVIMWRTDVKRKIPA